MLFFEIHWLKPLMVVQYSKFFVYDENRWNKVICNEEVLRCEVVGQTLDNNFWHLPHITEGCNLNRFCQFFPVQNSSAFFPEYILKIHDRQCMDDVSSKRVTEIIKAHSNIWHLPHIYGSMTTEYIYIYFNNDQKNCKSALDKIIMRSICHLVILSVAWLTDL